MDYKKKYLKYKLKYLTAKKLYGGADSGRKGSTKRKREPTEVKREPTEQDEEPPEEYEEGDEQEPPRVKEEGDEEGDEQEPPRVKEEGDEEGDEGEFEEEVRPIFTTELQRAAFYGDNISVTDLVFALEALEDPERRNLINEVNEHDGMNALMYAAQNGHSEVVEILIFHGAEINRQNKKDHDMNALMYATLYNNSSKVVEILLNQQDINIWAKTSPEGKTANMLSNFDNMNLTNSERSKINELFQDKIEEQARQEAEHEA